jgi:hypothetical protein
VKSADILARAVELNALAFSILVDDLHIWYITASVVLAAVNFPASFLVHRKLSYGLGPSLLHVPPG